eukprot:339991-Rhodomonas_salina.2
MQYRAHRHIHQVLQYTSILRRAQIWPQLPSAPVNAKRCEFRVEDNVRGSLDRVRTSWARFWTTGWDSGLRDETGIRFELHARISVFARGCAFALRDSSLWCEILDYGVRFCIRDKVRIRSARPGHSAAHAPRPPPSPALAALLRLVPDFAWQRRSMMP